MSERNFTPESARSETAAKAAVAAKAIPNCNICFIDGADMHSALSAFYEVMYSVAPDSIGGSIPGDDFYCVLG